MATYRIGDLLVEVDEREEVEPESEYPHLGVRWWGGGPFVRESKPGRDVKATKIKRVAAGRLIYNRLFAFRGSFAIVGPDCHGAYCSKEFPTYRVRRGAHDAPEVLLRFIKHAMNSPQYLTLVDAHSSGSTETSRNRFKQDAFEGFEIAMPSDPQELRRLVEILDAADLYEYALEGEGEGARPLRDSASGLLPDPPSQG